MYSDTQGHWAEAAINRWSGYGIVEGYGDKFRPDVSITRAQMAKILANTLGLTETAANPFTDVAENDWFAPYVLHCYAAGVMLGSGGQAQPNVTISRQQAMVMLCRALGIAPMENPDLSAYTDSGSVGAWAAPYVAALVESGIVGGVGNGLLAPGGGMSRAALMAVLDRSIVQYINEPGSYALTDGNGIVLVAAGNVTLTGTTSADILVTPAADGKGVAFDKAAVTGDITVQADGVKVTTKDSKLPEIALTGEGSKVEEAKQNAEPKRTEYGEDNDFDDSSSSGGSGGNTPASPSDLSVAEAGRTVSSGTYRNVTITSAVGDGDVTLSNLTIRGDLTIQGGGSSSIRLVNCTILGRIIMAKAGGEPPRLHLTQTPVARIEARTPAIVEAADAASAVAAVEAKADIEVKGGSTTVAAVTVPAGAESVVAVQVTAGTVAKVEAKGAAAVTGAENSVAAVVAEAPVTVASEAVAKVEVPAAAENVVVDVRGSSAIEVEVNSETTKVSAESGAAVTVSGEAKDSVATHTHIWNEGEVTTAPTCSAEGVRTFTCTAADCPNKAKTEPIEKTAHTPVTDPAVAATCTEAGKTEGSRCSVCNAALTAQQEIPALGHDFAGAWLSDAGGHWHKCSRCDVTDEKAAHTYPDNTPCDAAATCIVCGYEKAAGEHTWDEGKVTTAATCTAVGAKTFTCSVCKQTKTEEVTALGHDWGEWVKADDTNHKRTCSRDAAHTETETHTWDSGVITTEPTETETGVKTYTCTAEGCGATKTEDVTLGPCKIGTPELKTDGSKVWIETTVENLPGSTKIGIWLSANTASPMQTIGANSKYFVLTGQTPEMLY